jgi:MFS family permease
MIEAYAFFAAFAVQILVVSVLHAAWFTRYVRAKAEAQFPDWDGKSRDRFLGLYRVVNAGIAVLGLVLLGWLFNHMRSPDWDAVSVMRLLSGYSVVQMLPYVVVSLIGAWIKKKALLRSPPPSRRTASLQRRGLFDIVSPFTVSLAVVVYVLFAAFIISIQQHPVPGFPGYFILRVITLCYALNALVVYRLLYRRKRWPLETPTYRIQAVEVQVKIIVYAAIGIGVFASLIAALTLLHLVRWAPLAVSAYIVIAMLLTSMKLFALRRQAEADRLGLAS